MRVTSETHAPLMPESHRPTGLNRCNYTIIPFNDRVYQLDKAMKEPEYVFSNPLDGTVIFIQLRKRVAQAN